MIDVGAMLALRDPVAVQREFAGAEAAVAESTDAASQYLSALGAVIVACRNATIDGHRQLVTTVLRTTVVATNTAPDAAAAAVLADGMRVWHAITSLFDDLVVRFSLGPFAAVEAIVLVQAFCFISQTKEVVGESLMAALACFLARDAGRPDPYMLKRSAVTCLLGLVQGNAPNKERLRPHLPLIGKAVVETVDFFGQVQTAELLWRVTRQHKAWLDDVTTLPATLRRGIAELPSNSELISRTVTLLQGHNDRADPQTVFCLPCAEVEVGYKDGTPDVVYRQRFTETTAYLSAGCLVVLLPELGPAATLTLPMHAFGSARLHRDNKFGIRLAEPFIYDPKLEVRPPQRDDELALKLTAAALETTKRIPLRTWIVDAQQAKRRAEDADKGASTRPSVAGAAGVQDDAAAESPVTHHNPTASAHPSRQASAVPSHHGHLAPNTTVVSAPPSRQPSHVPPAPPPPVVETAPPQRFETTTRTKLSPQRRQRMDDAAQDPFEQLLQAPRPTTDDQSMPPPDALPAPSARRAGITERSDNVSYGVAAKPPSFGVAGSSDDASFYQRPSVVQSKTAAGLQLDLQQFQFATPRASIDRAASVQLGDDAVETFRQMLEGRVAARRGHVDNTLRWALAQIQREVDDAKEASRRDRSDFEGLVLSKVRELQAESDEAKEVVLQRFNEMNAALTEIRGISDVVRQRIDALDASASGAHSDARAREVEVLTELKRKVDDDIARLERSAMQVADTFDPKAFMQSFLDAHLSSSSAAGVHAVS